MIHSSLQSLLNSLKNVRHQNPTIVLVTGVFDLIHQEHINFLSSAKLAGDLLIVGLESDHRVKQIKGPNRPINHQHKRSTNVHSLSIADHIFILPQKFSTPRDHQDLIGKLKPSILAVSSHSPHLKAKSAILKKYDGTVKIVHTHNPKHSTTRMIQSPSE